MSRYRTLVVTTSMLAGLALSACGDQSTKLASPGPDATADVPSSSRTDVGDERAEIGSGAEVKADLPFSFDTPIGVDTNAGSDGGVDITGSSGGGVCPAGTNLYYGTPGCGMEARPICWVPNGMDASCAYVSMKYYCTCEGVTATKGGECGGSMIVPFLHEGACEIRGDAGVDAQPLCALQLKDLTCAKTGNLNPNFFCCPERFADARTGAFGCAYGAEDESTAAGACGVNLLIRRSSAGQGTVTCTYSSAGDLLGANVVEGPAATVQYCTTSRSVVAGDTISASCDPTGLPIVRTCTK